jgi:HTH-type transcriptional regulator / antitoxin MqsA
MDTLEKCSLCGIGHVSARSELVENDYKGTTAKLPLFFKACDHCMSDYSDASDAKENRRVLIAWHKEVDGLLRADEIANLRAAYGITQSQAARLFGGGPVAFSKYENNDVAQSESMDILLRLVRHSREAFDRLVAQRGMTAEISGAATTPRTLRLISNSTKSTYTIEDKDGGSSPNYNPREFRTYARSVCPQSNP